MDRANSKKVVGFWKQIWILLWKNWILLKRNKLGTVVEILVSLLFVVILIFLRFFVDSIKVDEQTSTTNPPRNVIDLVNTTTGRTLVLYYPNNAFIGGIVSSAVTLIQGQRPAFTATGKLFS
jgi:hypothetical protein